MVRDGHAAALVLVEDFALRVLLYKGECLLDFPLQNIACFALLDEV
jgi:hypothetical protein